MACLMRASVRANLGKHALSIRRFPHDIWLRQPLGLGTTRLFAKKAGKAAKAGKAGRGSKAADEDDDDDTDDDGNADVIQEVDINALSKRMQASFEHLQRDLGTMHAGRATPSMFDHVQVQQIAKAACHCL